MTSPICTSCRRGRLRRGSIDKTLARDGRTAVIRRVPALACDECGDVAFDTTVASALDTMARELLGSSDDAYAADDFPAGTTRG